MISSQNPIAMSAASRYWTLVRIDAAGKRKIEEINPAREFFRSSFPEFMVQSEVPDAAIQRKLLHRIREGTQEMRFLAEHRAFDQAKAYGDPGRLQTLYQQIEGALEEEVLRVIEEAAREASKATFAKNPITSSLFSERLCCHLDTRRNQL